MRDWYSVHVRSKGRRFARRWCKYYIIYLHPLLGENRASLSSDSQVDMSNIIDQAQKIIEANGFKDSK